MNNDFNRLAPVYDKLAKLVFGNKLDEAQCVFLSCIRPKSRLLIVGGGTGKIIEWLPENAELVVDYVELSGKMIDRSKRRLSKDNSIVFKQSDILMINNQYDVIISNFFMDCFAPKQLNHIISHLKELLTMQGLLIVTDFHPANGVMQKFLLVIMHRFFRLVANLGANHLTDINHHILKSGFNLWKKSFIKQGMVFSAVYQKKLAN